jgi:hypothetical protein
MFDEWKKRRKIKKRLASLKEQEAISNAQTDIYSPEYNPEAKPVMVGFEIGSLQRGLADMETNRLTTKARRLGIQLPPEKNWWLEDEMFEGEIIDGVYEGKYFLTEAGMAGVSKLIREERRRSIEWWVKIITPILSAAIALLGLIVALVSVSKK